jgi:hypothetical protein
VGNGIILKMFLDRINKINRILAWRTGDTEDGVFWHGEQEKQEEDWGCHLSPRRRRT